MHADIVVLPGDGIGPEVTAAAVDVLQAVAQRFGHCFSLHEHLIGGAAIDATGKPLPDATLAAARDADAVLLGAVGGPKWSDPNASVRPEQGLLAIRRWTDGAHRSSSSSAARTSGCDAKGSMVISAAVTASGGGPRASRASRAARPQARTAPPAPPHALA